MTEEVLILSQCSVFRNDTHTKDLDETHRCRCPDWDPCRSPSETTLQTGQTRVKIRTIYRPLWATGQPSNPGRPVNKDFLGGQYEGVRGDP